MNDEKPIATTMPLSEDLWGAMRGMVLVPQDLDLTQPSDEAWKADA